MALRRLAVVAFALSIPAALSGNVQVPNLTLPPDAAANKQAVKDAFVSAYSTYTKYAYGHDDLEPVSESYVDDYYGWGATIADAMDTMIVMGLTVNAFKSAIKIV